MGVGVAETGNDPGCMAGNVDRPHYRRVCGLPLTKAPPTCEPPAGALSQSHAPCHAPRHAPRHAASHAPDGSIDELVSLQLSHLIRLRPGTQVGHKGRHQVCAAHATRTPPSSRRKVMKFLFICGCGHSGTSGVRQDDVCCWLPHRNRSDRNNATPLPVAHSGNRRMTHRHN